MKIFVIAEREQPISELCGGARLFADEVCLVALPESSVISNVADVVYRLEVPETKMSEDAASSLAELIKQEQPEALFAEPSRRIQLIVGRVAAKLENSAIANVMEMPSAYEATTMYFGGLANRKFKKTLGTKVEADSKDDVKVDVKTKTGAGVGASAGIDTEAGYEPRLEVGMYFIRPATFLEVEPYGENKEINIEFIEPTYSVVRTGTSERVKGDVDLPSAKRIVSVGRGVKKEEDLAMIRELCSLINAELGCSRSIYESEEWLPKEALVGISGSTVTPDLYLAVGISGQAQHMVACDGSSTIMCINTDPYALIFEHSDYGSKGDLYTVIPRMVEYFKTHPLK